MTLKKQFTDKVLAIDSSIKKHEVKSYTAYRIERRQAFFRIYPNKITILLPYNEITKKEKSRYGLKDNSDRYPRHELQVKGPFLNQKYIEQNFIGLVKKAFIYTRDKKG